MEAWFEQMIQGRVDEDWFHESRRDATGRREPSPRFYDNVVRQYVVRVYIKST